MGAAELGSQSSILNQRPSPSPTWASKSFMLSLLSSWFRPRIRSRRSIWTCIWVKGGEVLRVRSQGAEEKNLTWRRALGGSGGFPIASLSLCLGATGPVGPGRDPEMCEARGLGDRLFFYLLVNWIF